MTNQQLRLYEGVSEKNPYIRNDEDSMLVFRGLIMPDHFFTHLNYSINTLLLANAASSGLYQFRGGDCYDPDFTGTGDQPLGFDQFMAFYTRFRVHGSHFEWKPVQVSQLSTACLVPTVSSSVPAAMRTKEEMPYAIFQAYSSTVLPVGYKLSKYIETRKIYGYPNIVQNDGFSGTSSSSPSLNWFWSIYVESFDNSTTMTVRGNIKITYDVEFLTRVNLSISEDEPQEQVHLVIDGESNYISIPLQEYQELLTAKVLFEDITPDPT